MATVAFAGCVAWVLSSSWLSLARSDINVKDRNLNAALLAAIFAAGVYSLFSGILVMPIPQTLFFLIAGVVWGKSRSLAKQSGVDALELKFSRSFSYGLVLVVILGIYVHMMSEYFSQQFDVIEERRGTRLWSNGAAFFAK